MLTFGHSDNSIGLCAVDGALNMQYRTDDLLEANKDRDASGDLEVGGKFSSCLDSLAPCRTFQGYVGRPQT